MHITHRSVLTKQLLQLGRLTSSTMTHTFFGMTTHDSLLDTDDDIATQCYNAATGDTRCITKDSNINESKIPCPTTTTFPTTKMILTGISVQELSDCANESARMHSRTSSLLPTRNIILDSIDMGLSSHPGCEERNIVLCDTGVSGNIHDTVRDFLKTKRHAIKAGRVIICCGNAQFVNRVLEARSTMMIDEAVCEMIRLHVERVCGRPQDPLNYCDPQTAYATWESETEYFQCGGEKSKPLIVLVLDGVCEELGKRAHPSLVHKSSGKPYTLLEGVCLAVPSPNGIFVIGRNAKIDATDPTFLSQANVTNVTLPANATSASTTRTNAHSPDTEVKHFHLLD